MLIMKVLVNTHDMAYTVRFANGTCEQYNEKNVPDEVLQFCQDCTHHTALSSCYHEYTM